MAEDIESRLREIVEEYSCSAQPFQPQLYLGRDIGITGEDCVEFLEQVEAEFGVDLAPLIERGPPPKPQPWWTWLSGGRVGVTGVDVTFAELLDYIHGSATRASSD